MSTAVIELLGRAYQTDITLLNQVQEGDSAPHVFLGDRDDQTGVRRDEMLAGCPTVLDQLA